MMKNYFIKSLLMGLASMLLVSTLFVIAGSPEANAWKVGFHAEQSWTSPGKVADENVKATYLTQTMNSLLSNLSPRRPIFWYNLHEPSCSNGYGLVQ